MTQEKLPSINEELKKNVGKDQTENVQQYYEEQAKTNLNTDSTESFAERTRAAYDKALGDTDYISYVNKVENNIGSIRERLTNNIDTEIKNKP